MSYAHPQSPAGKAVIVTDAAQGVGKGIAGALVQRGASVLMVDCRPEVLAAAVDEFATASWPSEHPVADLRDPLSAGAIVDQRAKTIAGHHQ